VASRATARSSAFSASRLPHPLTIAQTWWNYYANRTRADGDGRPIALTLSHVRSGIVRNFRINAQPFWCNTVADSTNVLYDGMMCNATNTNPAYAGTNLVPNTDGGLQLHMSGVGETDPQRKGINTYRSKNVAMLNWDVCIGFRFLRIASEPTL
jgi:galacturan 1,4-alpha-galacturonidase